MNLSACNLAEKLERLDDVEIGKFEIVCASMPSVRNRSFSVNYLLQKDSVFGGCLLACVVDKSHTGCIVETWTSLG